MSQDEQVTQDVSVEMNIESIFFRNCNDVDIMWKKKKPRPNCSQMTVNNYARKKG